jgi:hypothetical protein
MPHTSVLFHTSTVTPLAVRVLYHKITLSLSVSVLPLLSSMSDAENVWTVYPAQFRASYFHFDIVSHLFPCFMRPIFSRNLVFSFTCALASVIVRPLAKPRFHIEKLLTLCSCFFRTECSALSVPNFRMTLHQSSS